MQNIKECIANIIYKKKNFVKISRDSLANAFISRKSV